MRSPTPRTPATRFSVVGVAAVVALAATGCTAQPAADGESSITIRVSALPNEGNWSPALGGGGYDPSGQAVFDSLFHFVGETGEIGPWLAREFEISDDGLTIDVILEEGVEFSDGTPVNAENVATYYNGMLDSENWGFTGILRGQFDARAEAVSEYELRFTTKIPLHDLWIRAMTYVPILPPSAVRDPESLRDEPVGSGPYLLDESKPGISMSFVRKAGYWNADEFDFDRVTLVVYEDDVAALNALKSGQIDATEIDSTLAAEAEASGFAISTGSGIGSAYSIMFRDRIGDVAPALGDIRVRQAINMAFDRAAIADTLFSGYGAVSSQPFASNHLHYVEGGDDRYRYDLDAARDLLADAGYPDGFDLPIATAAEFASAQPIVEQSLADIGIRVTWEVRPDMAALTQDVTYAAALVELALIGAVDWLEFFWGFSTPESVELHQTFKKAAPAESVAAGAELGEYILENAWYAPFAHPDVIFASIPDVEVAVDHIVIELEQYKRR